MATVAKRHDKKTSTQRQGVVPNIISGLATGLFSIPEGMAYAQLRWQPSQSWDFLGEGLSNLSGSFFQSMATGSFLILADVDPAVEKELQASGALDVIGAENVFPATSRVLEAEKTAWEAAQKRIAERIDNK